MLEKIGRVRMYDQRLRKGLISFEDSTPDIPIYYQTLKLNELEYLKTGQKVFVVYRQHKDHKHIEEIEILTEHKIDKI